MGTLVVDQNLFYDTQLSNDKLVWQLMAQPWSSEGDQVMNGDDFSVEVIRGILPDTEVKLSGNNSFDSNFLGSDLAAEAKDKAQKAQDAFTTSLTGTSDIRKNLFGSDLKEEEGSGTLLDKLGKASNNQVTMGTDYVKMYRGCEVTYNIPSISTTIYYGQYEQSVTSIVESIIKRIMGPYRAFGDGEASFMGLQAPPNGYQPSFTNIGNWDTKLDGTFILQYGGYEYRYLLCSGFEITLSTLGVKSKTSLSEPLYAKIEMSFIPASFVTRDVVLKFLGSKTF